VTWDSTDNYLPGLFYSKKSPVSLSVFKHWISLDPITADGDILASYNQVELVILGFGLAFRALWVAQFPERFSDVPKYILKSSYPFSEYEQLSYDVEDLIAGYMEMYVSLSSIVINQYTNFFQRLQQLQAVHRSLPRPPKDTMTKNASRKVGKGNTGGTDVAGNKDIMVGDTVDSSDAQSHHSV
jgi:hypothetical protein